MEELSEGPESLSSITGGGWCCICSGTGAITEATVEVDTAAVEVPLIPPRPLDAIPPKPKSSKSMPLSLSKAPRSTVP